MRNLITKFISYKTASQLAESTLDSYCYALRDFYQYCIRNNITMPTSTDIENYFIFLRGKRYSQATLRDKYAVLHAFFTYCVNNGLIDDFPLRIKKPFLPKEKARCFTDEEIAKIMAYFTDRSTFCKLRDFTIISILLGTGIRRSELLQITDITGDYLTVIGKGNKQRSVPLSRSLKTVLKDYIVERNKRAVCKYLIVTNRGTQMTKGGLRAVLIRLSQNTGIGGKRFSSHTFRHTYATSMLRAGADIATISRILGHSDISTTAIYLNWTDDTARQVNDRYNPLNKFFNFF